MPHAVNLEVGAPVRVRFTKWGGGPHWEYTGEYLGADAHGRWIGFRPPTVCVRPGRTIRFERHFVVVFPSAGWYAASFNERPEPPAGVEVYVDICTVPVWSPSAEGHAVTAADLDLDVIRYWDGTVLVDDADEFAEHQIVLAYPAEIVAAAERACGAVSTAVEHRAEPFDTVGRGWLERLVRGVAERR